MSCEGKSARQRKRERSDCLSKNKTEKPKHPYIYVGCECKQTTKSIDELRKSKGSGVDRLVKKHIKKEL